MTTQAHTQEKVVLSTTKPLIGGATFDWFFLIPAFCFVAGGYTDTWAHNHVLVFETFFTPWHAALYSSFLVTMLVLIGAILINRSRSVSWRDAIPIGYGLSVVGMLGFALGGVGDSIWHTLFGFERSTDAQFSPTHVVLIISGAIFVSGAYRALYRRAKDAGKRGQILLTFATTVFYAFLMLDAQNTHPFLKFWTLIPSFNSLGQSAAIIGFLFQTILFTGLALYTIRRWQLFPGFFTILLGINAIPLSFMFDHYIMILIGFVAGLLTDGAYLLLRPSMERPFEFRLFAAVAPALLYLAYFLVLALLGDVIWSIHLTAGTIVFTGVVGWVVSYLVLPGRSPEIVPG